MSDPPADLQAERETFVRNFLHKGVELTEDLIRENQALQAEVRKLEDDNGRLRAQLASNDAIRELLGTIDALERERKSLLTRSDKLEQAFRQNEARQHSIEQELNDLASLYVASFQLGGTLSLRSVVRHICELLEQLVGAQAFVVYVMGVDPKSAVPIGWRGMGSEVLAPVSTEEGPVGDVWLTGVARVIDPASHAGSPAPLAVVPLSFQGETVGVIAVSKLLPHKQAWAPVDHELFKLLSAHGATAVIAANLYERESGVRAALQDVAQHVDEAQRERALSEAKLGLEP